MPFDPILTDEKIEGGAPHKPDFDAQMMAGCSQFVIESIAIYGLGAWPFFIFPDVFLVSKLAINFALGLIPALILMVFATRKFGLAAAAGCLGGSMVLGIFLYLRLQQVHIPSVLNSVPQPEWPKQWVWMLPLAILALTGIILALSLKRSEWSLEEQKETPKGTGNSADN
jgi:hypothetical protein